MSDFYLGTCDVCGEAIATKHDFPVDGIIDIYFTDDRRPYTYIRHYAVAPEHANPDCAKFSSKVYSVEAPPELVAPVDGEEQN